MLPHALPLRRGVGHSLLVFCLMAVPRAAAQAPAPLRLDGIMVAGARSSVTNAWGTFDFVLTNMSDQDRQARVLFFYDGRPEIQYGRDVWIPARSSLTSWLLAGPAPPHGSPTQRNLQLLLYDRTEGEPRLVLPPTEERVRSRTVLHRGREPFTTVVLDDEKEPGHNFGSLPEPATADAETVELVRTLRDAAHLSAFTPLVRGGPLPATPEAFDGIDHLVLASNRVAADPVGLRAIRQWVLGGGTVWVLLDRVDAEVVAPLLGDALDFEVVDRLTLTNFRIERQKDRPPLREPAQEHERPVAFVRVLLPRAEAARYTIDGWPLMFTRPVGRGKVVFTTLGARGWTRPRHERDHRSSFPDFPTLPVALDPLHGLAAEVHAPDQGAPFRVDAFRQPLTDEIGYSIIGRGTVALVFAAFLAGVLGLGLALRGPGRREALGLIAPALALLTAGAFLALGERSRRTAAPTVAVGAVVESGPGMEEASVRGLLAVYRPDGGPAPVGAEQGGVFEIDQAGAAGQTRRLLLDDLDAWRWEGLTLPAGIRLAPFRQAAPTGEAIRALASLTAFGLEGELTAGPFRGVSDAILITPADRALGVRLGPDGTFRAGSPDVLPAGQFLAGTLLSDRRQRRQELYRQFLTKRPAHLRGRNLLLAWADPIDPHFRLPPGARTVGDALLVVPLELRPSAAESPVTIPPALMPYQRLQDGVQSHFTREFQQGTEQHLRFQVPATALPLKVERVRFSARIDAPARRVTLSARDGEGFAEVLRVESPLDTLRVEIADPRLLALDDQGGLHLRLAVGDLPGGDRKGAVGPSEEKWTISFVELEVLGRTGPEP